MPHFAALLEQLFQLRMNREIRRVACEPVGDFAESFQSDSGIHFVGIVEAASLVRRPVRRQFAEARLFLHFTCSLVRAFQLIANGVNRGSRIHPDLLRVDLP